MILIIIYIGLKKWFDMLPTNAIATASFVLNTVDSDKTFQVFPPGEFRAGDGRPKNVKAWWFGDKLLDYLKSLQNDVVIDYEHQSLNTVDNGKEAPAAGWANTFLATDGGLLCVNPQWTPRARAMLENDEYRYISPVFTYDGETGEILRLHSIALTNTPAIDGMKPVVLSQSQGHSTIMDTLRELLKLPPEATDENILNAVKALQEKADEQPPHSKPKDTKPQDKQEPLKSLLPTDSEVGNIDPSQYVPVAVLRAVQTDLARLNAKLNQIEQANELGEKENLIRENQDAFLSEETRKWAMSLSLAALKDYVKHMPHITALKRSQTGGVSPPTSENTELSPEELQVCRMLDLKPEAFKGVSP